MSLMQLLNLRCDFELLTNDFQIPKGSSINTIEWFIENGHRSNRLRNGFDDAMNLAHKIKEFSYGRGDEKSWLSSS
jgi:hypothetical protein